MKIQFLKVPQDCAIIEDWFDESLLPKIFDELEMIRKEKLIQADAVGIGSAVSHDGKSLLRKGHGFFLDQIYLTDRSVSPILMANAKIFDEELAKELIKGSPYFEQIAVSNKDTTLVNYYFEGDEYQEHRDAVSWTVCTFLWKEPKSFSGGNFFLNGNKVEIKNNMTVIFPGFVKHGAEKVTMFDGASPDQGRWSIAHFIGYRF